MLASPAEREKEKTKSLSSHVHAISPSLIGRLAMCIGDSVSGPSCRAAAAGLADRLELRSVEFPRASGTKVLLNGMTSANVRKCMASWMGSVPWRAVVFGAGAWDLQTNGCCETDAAHLQRIVDNVRDTVETVLSR